MDCMKLFCVVMNLLCRDESRYTRHVSAISGYPISIDFRKLTGCRQDPRVLGHHKDHIPLSTVADPETPRGGGGANSLINYYFFLKIYQYIEIKYEQLY